MSPPIDSTGPISPFAGRDVTLLDVMLELKDQSKDLKHIKGKQEEMCLTLHGERTDQRDGLVARVAKLEDKHKQQAKWVRRAIALLFSSGGIGGLIAWFKSGGTTPHG